MSRSRRKRRMKQQQRRLERILAKAAMLEIELYLTGNRWSWRSLNNRDHFSMFSYTSPGDALHNAIGFFNHHP